MKILIIPGHGAGDPGAAATHGGVSYQEQAETRALAKLVAQQLTSYAAVTIYPTTRNAYTDYQKGVLNETAMFQNYDYVLELHFNAASKDSGDGRVKGSEVYVTTGQQSVTVETAMLQELAALGFTNRGVKRKNFSVIAAAKAAGVSSCLLETCFIDDADDMALYTAKKNTVAQAIAKGIIRGFSLTSGSEMTVETAVAKLSSAGIINTPEYWLQNYKALPYLGELLINMAKRV